MMASRNLAICTPLHYPHGSGPFSFYSPHYRWFRNVLTKVSRARPHPLRDERPLPYLAFWVFRDLSDVFINWILFE